MHESVPGHPCLGYSYQFGVFLELLTLPHLLLKLFSYYVVALFSVNMRSIALTFCILFILVCFCSPGGLPYSEKETELEE